MGASPRRARKHRGEAVIFSAQRSQTPIPMFFENPVHPCEVETREPGTSGNGRTERRTAVSPAPRLRAFGRKPASGRHSPANGIPLDSRKFFLVDARFSVRKSGRGAVKVEFSPGLPSERTRKTHSKNQKTACYQAVCKSRVQTRIAVDRVAAGRRRPRLRVSRAVVMVMPPDEIARSSTGQRT